MKIRNYIQEIFTVIASGEADNFVDELVKIISVSASDKRRIWILGNGGSLAIAQHFAQDLLKLCGVRAQCPNDPSVITAYSNDHDFSYCFHAPLQILSDKGKDIVIIFSCSGKSRNYTEFVSSFGEGFFSKVVAVIGTDGGFLAEKADLSFHVRSQDYQICEASFSIICDLTVKGLLESKGE